MDKHLTIMGAMHLAVAALGLLAIPIVLLALNGTGAAAILAGEPGAFVLLSGIGTFVSLMIFAVSIPNLVAGVGLLRRRAWSRAGASFAIVINLVNPPFGPILAAYTLWVLLKTDWQPARA
jgi:hypothetical protein